MNARIVRFYAVGVLGVGVQLTALGALAYGAGLHHSISTAIAVEIAVIHNFIWHEHWTWAPDTPGVWNRFCKFNLSTGFISIVANIAVTAALVEFFSMPYLLANSLAIAAASLATYLAADLFVFKVGSACSPAQLRSSRGPGDDILVSNTSIGSKTQRALT